MIIILGMEAGINIRNFFSKNVIAFIIILLMVLVVHFPMFKNLKDSTLPFVAKPDAHYILSVIEWNMYSMLNDLPAIYHLNYYYPNAYVTFYGHPLFGEAMVFLGFNKILGLNITRSWIFYLLFMFFFGAVGCLLLTRELTRHPLIPYFAAFLFIIYPYIRQLYTQLNVVSFFWIGFVLYFLVKFQKNGKWKDALLAGFFAFLQALFSIYHGFFLIAILVPVFALVSLCIGTINFKNMLKLSASFFPFLILLLVVFFPFLSVMKYSGFYRGLHYSSLVDVRILFSSVSPFYKQFHPYQFNAIFPGFSVLFLFTAALTGIKKKQLILISILSLSLLMVFILDFKGFPLPANWLLVSIFIVHVIVFIRRFKSLSLEVRVLFALIFIYFVIFFKFSSIIPGSNFSIYGLLVYFIPPFSNFRFLYRGMMALVPVFAALTAYGLSKMLEIKGKLKYLLLASLILLVIFENGYISNKSGNFNFKPQKYRKIEKESDRIILELPIYGKKSIIKNNKYTINTIFHNNYYVNGRISVRVFKDNLIVEKKISNKNFPDEHTLRWLLKNYSVDYLIFNWESEIFKEKEKIIKKVEILNRWCEILDSSPEFLVVRLKENFPVKRIKRRYSLFHIKRRKIVLDFSAPYEGKIWGFYSGDTGKVAKIERPDPLRAKIEFPVINLGLDGVPIEIHFETPIKLKDIRLERK